MREYVVFRRPLGPPSLRTADAAQTEAERQTRATGEPHCVAMVLRTVRLTVEHHQPDPPITIEEEPI